MACASHQKFPSAGVKSVPPALPARMELLPMMAFWWIAGAALAFVWIWRLCEAAIGIRCVPELADLQWNAPLKQTPRVSIIVPARNEEAAMESALRSLLALDYPDRS